MIGLGHDFRMGVRALGRRPGLAVVAVLTLALGLGGATTMFGALRVVMSTALPPIPEPDRVARLWAVDPASGLDRLALEPQEFLSLESTVKSLDALAAFTEVPATARILDAPVRISVVRASTRYLDVMGIVPVQGRWFGEADERLGESRIVVVSETFCTRVLGDNKAVLGQTVTINGEPRTIVGVMPASFGFPLRGTDAWMPLDLGAINGPAPAPPVHAVGRLRADMTWTQAQAEVSTISSNLSRSARSGGKRSIRVVPVGEDASKRLGLGIFGLMGPAVLLLLVACGNVANLLLVRAAERRREMAVRAVLGAGPARLVRELVAESVTLAVPAGVAGTVLAYWGFAVFRGLFSRVSPELGGLMVFEWKSLGFALVATLAAPLVFGLAPAVHAARVDLNAAIKDGYTTRGRRRGHYGFSDLIICAEVALGVILVVVSGLLVRFFWEVNHLERGFDAANVLSIGVSIPEGRYPSEDDMREFYGAVIARVRAVPGVRDASVASTTVVMGMAPGEGEAVELARGPAPTASGPLRAGTARVGPGYFAATGIPIRLGRTILAADGRGAERVAVISESAAKTFWPGGDPLGQRFKLRRDSPDSPSILVVGVVGDVMSSRRLPVRPAIYTAFDQAPSRSGMLMVRTSRDPLGVVADVKRAMWAIDPDLILDVSRLDEWLARFNAGATITVGSIAVFAALALLLATVGLYSVIGQAVARRTRDIGVRLALGARPHDVLAPVIGQHLTLMVVGFGAGALGTLAVTRVVWQELLTISVADPAMWVALLFVLAGVGLAASTAPARRALRVDPIVALRCE